MQKITPPESPFEQATPEVCPHSAIPSTEQLGGSPLAGPPLPQSITLFERRFQVFQSKARFRVVVAGRRFGKTHLALVEMIKAAKLGGKLIWYVGPTDDQSKQIAWDRLKEMTQPYWARLPLETELRIDLIWGATLRVNGAFKPDSLRGRGLDLVVIDEFASMKPEVWRSVVRPALADRKGRALFIGTPMGRNHFYEQYEYALDAEDWEAFHFTTAQGGLVGEEELKSAARELDPETFEREFEAKFTDVGRHRVYYAFDRAGNVMPLKFDQRLPLVWSLDFNVDPMCMLLMQRNGDEVHVLEELIVKQHATTLAACELFHRRASELFADLPYLFRPMSVEVYGDASGYQNRTSGSMTDWAMVRNFLGRFPYQYKVAYWMRSVNPGVRDRVNCVNSRLKTMDGERRLFIDPKCKELIRDLEQVAWALNRNGSATTELDKSDRARTHTSDALGYYVAQEFTLRLKIGEQSGKLTLGW